MHVSRGGANHSRKIYAANIMSIVLGKKKHALAVWGTEARQD